MMTLKISFSGDAFLDEQSLLNFMLSVMHFHPETLLGPGGQYVKFDKNGALAELKAHKSLQISDGYYAAHDEKNYVFFRQSEPNYFTQVITFFSHALTDAAVAKIIQASYRHHFFLAYRYNALLVLNQNEILPGNFEYLGKPHTHLKKIWDPVLSPLLNSEIIDIRENPGHEKLTYGTWLMAAPEMWFGNVSWQYFDKKKINAFKGAEVIAQLQPDLLYVRLFDPLAADYETNEILDLQKSFRIASEMNKIEEKLDAISMQKRIENGNQVKSITQKMLVDKNGSSTLEETPEKKEHIISVARHIYQGLKTKYDSYDFDDLTSFPNQDYSIMSFRKTVAEGVMKFVIEMPGNPIRIYKAGIKLYPNGGAAPIPIKAYSEYDEILKDARKLGKGNKKI